MPKKILIVDDEQDLAATLAASFGAFNGTTVATAFDPELGLAKANSWHPDVILMDITMPKMDGWEATKRLKADPETKSIPVVIMTAVLSKKLLEQARKAGAQRVITKPFADRDIARLMEWLETQAGRVRPA